MILASHISIFFLALVLYDISALKFSCSSSYELHLDKITIDEDAFAECERITALNLNKKSANTSDEDEEQETGHLIVHNLVKHFPKRN